MQGADPAAVEAAIASGTPFTGDAGFGGALPDGRLVRDVLGRYPVFLEDGAPTAWAVDPRELSTPRPLAAGTVMDAGSVERVWELPRSSPFEDDPTGRRALEGAILDRASALEDDVPIGFSGGVDSALLARLGEGPLYTVGFPDEPDLAAAREVAETLDRTLRVIELTHEDLRGAIPAVARATGRENAMGLAIGLSLYVLADAVAADGYDRVALGQGADELFGGYEKIARLDHRVAADTVDGARREVVGELPSGLARDVLAVRAGGVEPVMPYLGDGVVEAALRLEGDQLVDDRRRKSLFRDVAGRHLPASVAQREKKAIQYGNGVARELDRIARQAGFKRHMGNHVAQYVRALSH